MGDFCGYCGADLCDLCHFCPDCGCDCYVDPYEHETGIYSPDYPMEDDY